MTGKELGRLPAGMTGLPKLDAPQQTVQAILSKQDEIIAKLNTLLGEGVEKIKEVELSL